MFNPQPKPQKAEPKKPKRMRSVSVKRARENVIYLKIKKLHLELFPACVVCGQQSNQVHHAKGRIGHLLIERKYFKSMCDPCHKEVEVNPEWAKQNGYSIDRL